MRDLSELDELRLRVAHVDDEIIHLIGERIQWARQIGGIKRQQGLPLRDWEVERTVLERTAAAATQCHVPAPLARTVMQTLMSESRIEQERRSFSVYEGAAETITIVGGHGKMGRWFVEFFTNQGHRVRVHDIVGTQGEPGGAPSLSCAAGDSSFVLVAAPLQSIPLVIRELAESQYKGIVFDIASLKSHLKPCVSMARQRGLRLTSIHPMFGPRVRTLSDQVICICDCGDPSATQRVREFFSPTAATLVDLSFDEHDRIVSFVLGLAHMTSLLFLRVLMRSGMSLQSLNKVGSTTFHAQMNTSAPVVEENPELYRAIQALNPFTAELYNHIREELDSLMRVIQSEDHGEFAALMNAAREWAGHRKP